MGIPYFKDLRKYQDHGKLDGLHKGIPMHQNDDYGRLRRQHLLHKEVLDGRLIRVSLPTDHLIEILDSGTGDGIWMLDAADEYPNATFTGTDISSMHLSQLKDFMPSNIYLREQSLLDRWPPIHVGKYDMVHQRYCLAQFSPERDAQIVSELFGLVKPGGFIQLLESDMMSFDGGEGHEGMSEFMEFVDKAFSQANLNHRPGPGIAKWLEQAGARNIKEEIYSFKIGAAADTVALKNETAANVASIIDEFATVVSKWPGYWYTPEDFRKLSNAISKEMKTAGNVWKFWLVTAQK